MRSAWRDVVDQSAVVENAMPTRKTPWRQPPFDPLEAAVSAERVHPGPETLL
jgi:hypothetical protein